MFLVFITRLDWLENSPLSALFVCFIPLQAALNICEHLLRVSLSDSLLFQKEQ